MQQDPYAAFSRPVGQADPYAGIAAPAAQGPARRASPAPAPARPAAVRPQQPAPQAAPAPVLNDLGITDDEERAALIAQGYTPQEADAFLYDPGMAPAQPALPTDTINQHVPENYYPDSAAALEASGPAYSGPGTSEANPFVLREGDQSPEYRDALQSLSRGMYIQTPDGVRRLSGDPYINENPDPNDARVGQAVLREENLADQSRAFAMAAAEQIPFLDEAAVGAAGLVSGRGYSDVRDSYQAVQGIDNQVNRNQRIAGGIAGAGTSLIAPGSSFLKGSTGLLNASLRSAAVGAGYGAVYGAGADEGGLLDRADGAAGGLVFGGLLGGALPPVLNTGRALLGGVVGAADDGARILSDVPQNAPAATDDLVVPFQTPQRPPAAATAAPAASASRPETRVAGALRRAIERDAMTPQQVLDNLAAAPDGQLPFQTGGENLVGLAETMANVPGAARRQIVSAARGQSEGESNRVSGLLADSFGAQGNGWQALRQRITARGAEADTGMAAIADDVVPLDDASVRAFRSKLTSPAVRSAAEEAIAELSPEGSAAANRLFGLGDALLDNPGAATITVREAQDISYALNEAASRAYRGGFNSRGEALSTLSRSIRQNAREQVGGYDTWLKSFGDASEIIDGQRVGQNVFARANERNAMSAAELSERWAKWSVPARDAYRLGVGEAVLDRVRGQGGATAMRKLLKDDELAARVRIAFDSEDAFIAFMKSADDQVTMANTRGQVLAGSPSARRLAGQSDLQQQGVGIGDAADFLTDMSSPVGLLRQTAKVAAKSLPRRDRSIIGDEELNGLLGAALTDEAAMTRLLNLMSADDALRARARARGAQSGLLSAPYGRVVSGQAGQASGGLLSQ